MQCKDLANRQTVGFPVWDDDGNTNQKRHKERIAVHEFDISIVSLYGRHRSIIDSSAHKRKLAIFCKEISRTVDPNWNYFEVFDFLKLSGPLASSSACANLGIRN